MNGTFSAFALSYIFHSNQKIFSRSDARIISMSYLSLLRGDHTIIEVSLIGHEHFAGASLCKGVNLLQPLVNSIETLLHGNIIDNNDALSAPIITRCATRFQLFSIPHYTNSCLLTLCGIALVLPCPTVEKEDQRSRTTRISIEIALPSEA